MKPWRIALLALVTAALGAYLYFFELPKAERESAKKKLLDVSADAVTGLTLTFPDREIELEKADGHWRLVRPIAAPADDTAVSTVVSTIVGSEVQKTIDELPKNLADFGLEKPDPLVRVVAGERTLPEVKFGRTTAVGGKAYAQRGDEPTILLVPSSIRFGLDKQVDDLRDKRLVDFKDDAVTKVTITRGNQVVALTKTKDDDWTVDPGGHPADLTEVRSYLSSLRSTRALGFADDAPADLATYGLDAPQLRVALYTGGDTPAQELLIGGDTTEKDQKRLYAKRADRPGVVTVGEWTMRSLDKTVGQLRDKTLLAFDAADVGRIALERSDGQGFVAIRGEGAAWTIEGGGTARSAVLQRFVDDTRDLRGSDVAAEPAGDLVAFGLDAPALRITVTGKDGKEIGTLLVAKHGDKYFAMRAGGSTVFETRDYMYTRLDKKRADVVETPPAPDTPAP
ncbi:MAG TPA: DUF4340 domain-containing protein [Candidatus Limnocylindria bacterium]|nr:DUF4340 domain-containing protein [Candidatus Limnocylindria bacterium]